MAHGEGWTFEPLIVEDLRKVSGGLWTDHQVRELNRRLKNYCAAPRDKLSVSSKDREDSKARTQQVKGEIVAIDASLQKLGTAGVILPHDIPNMLMSRLHRGEPIRQGLLAKRNLLERELQSLRRPRGPKPNIALEYFIVIVADACHGVGVRVSARRNINGRLDSPFLRVLSLANGRLPADRRANSEAALRARARDTGIAWWRWFRFSAPEPRRRARTKAR